MVVFGASGEASVGGSSVVVFVGAVVVVMHRILAMSRMFCSLLSCRHNLLCSCVVMFSCAVVTVFVVLLIFPEHGICCSFMLVRFLPLYLLCKC